MSKQVMNKPEVISKILYILHFNTSTSLTQTHTHRDQHNVAKIVFEGTTIKLSSLNSGHRLSNDNIHNTHIHKQTKEGHKYILHCHHR